MDSLEEGAHVDEGERLKRKSMDKERKKQINEKQKKLKSIDGKHFSL